MDIVRLFIPKYGHRDSARGMIQSWNDLGLVSIHSSPDMFVWWNEPGDVLLFDYDLLRDYLPLPKYNKILFGNEFIPSIPNAHKWIFWGRHPKILEEKYKTMEKIDPGSREVHSIFAGKVENPTQHQNRFTTKINWSNHIEDFSIVYGVQSNYKYTHEEYLHRLSQSKFSLHLPGYGPKCNREIEAAAMGCIPIVTPGVDVDYYSPWVENVNYLRLNKKSDFGDIFNTDVSLLTEIQNNNFEWYERNCSTTGSFETTCKIIRK